jgi:outer membrane receptor protein involved in Fe transport
MPDSTTTQVEARDESLLRSYLYWTPTDSVSIAAEYQFERIEGNGDILVDGIKEVSTHRIPLTVNMFGRSRIHGGIKATWIEQRGQFNALTQIPDPIIEPGQDSFWVVDLSLSYRLPRRRGNVSLNIDNAFDTDFRFQDTDPENPTLMPERLLALRFTLAY